MIQTLIQLFTGLNISMEPHVRLWVGCSAGWLVGRSVGLPLLSRKTWKQHFHARKRIATDIKRISFRHPFAILLRPHPFAILFSFHLRLPVK